GPGASQGARACDANGWLQDNSRELERAGRGDRQAPDQRCRQLTVTAETSSPPTIDAVPLRHPWRWLSAAVIIALVGLFLYGAATNPDYHWSTYSKYIFDQRISTAAWNTIQLTALSMLLAVVLGVALAVMRLSPNPVLRSVSWAYIWIFRGTP